MYLLNYYFFFPKKELNKLEQEDKHSEATKKQNRTKIELS